jgi:uncharacterized protein
VGVGDAASRGATRDSMSGPAQSQVIPGPAGALEALVDAAPLPRAVAVVCHPHPLHGGTMQNKVTYTLARAFQRLGAAAVRFNYRGVGESAGSFADGDGEADDACAVRDWALARWPGRDVYLAGFSFGAMVALRLARDARGLALVAPPVAKYAMNEAVPAIPWVVVQGDRDEVVAPADVYAWCSERSPAPKLVVVEGATHFFHGKLRDVAAAVEETFAASLDDAAVER